MSSKDKSLGRSLNLNTIQSLVDVHQMILKKRTGGLYHLADLLHMSSTTLQRRLDALRGLGAEITFDKNLNTYQYENNFEMSFKVSYDW